jgi:NAD(P)-dependent dehydrogenase (short-subunit alcohol dehydrogenase family)
MDRIDAMKVFVTAVDEGSLAGAARRLKRSATAASRALVFLEAHAGLVVLHPVGRMGEIRDIVDAVLYLETAGFVTGQILHVDGGQSAGRW